MPMDRRSFLASGAALAASAALPAFAAAPRLKLGLAAYSMRKYLDLKNPTMTLEEFIDKAAEWGVDGVELTEYYFKKPITPEYITKIKRACIKAGLPAFRLDAKRWVFPLDECEAWLREHGYVVDPYRVQIKRLVDAAPPLTADQAAKIRAILGGGA